MRRLTIDSNIYVSAFRFGGKPMQLLQMALAGDIEVALSQAIVDETLRILRDKFGFGIPQLEDVLSVMESCAVRVVPRRRLT